MLFCAVLRLLGVVEFSMALLKNQKHHDETVHILMHD